MRTDDVPESFTYQADFPTLNAPTEWRSFLPRPTSRHTSLPKTTARARFCF
jgi:hypothetical protein